MEDIIAFLKELDKNNNKDWFENNKDFYKITQSKFNDIVESLIKEIQKFDSSIKNISYKDCVYRLHRDIRFSKDKTPYKNYFGAYICPEGKKSGYSGYYFHIEPTSSFLGNILAAGFICPEPKVLQSLRDDVFDNGKEYINAINKAQGFVLDQTNKLKNVPKGFPKNCEFGELLKLKDFTIIKSVDEKFLLDKNIIENTIKEFKSTLEFNKLINRSVDFAKENM